MAKRYSQPQGKALIDWGNPITRGIVGAYLPQGINAVTNAAAVSITAPKTATKQGSGLLFAGGTEVAKYDSYQPSVPFTALTLLVPNFSSASATRQGVWVYQATSGSAQNRLRMIWLDATNGFYIDINGGFAYRCKPTFAAGDAIALAYTRAGVTSSNQFYVNGVAATTTQVVDTNNTGLPSPAAPLWLGDDVEFSSGKRLNGTIALHLHFSRVLTDAEIKSLSENPWQIFAPAARSIWVPVAAGGPTYTLTADSGSFALTGQAAGLSFNRTLAADSGSFALTGQATGLALNRVLSAASGSFALTGQAAGLAVNRTLSAASGSYSLTGQNATLTYTPTSTATYTLAAASGSFAVSGQDVVLAYNRVLSAANGSYLLTGQNATLVGPGLFTQAQLDYMLAYCQANMTGILKRWNGSAWV